MVRVPIASAMATLLLLEFLAPRGATAEEHAYVGVRKCGSCHKKELYGDQISAWRAGRHAKAFETLASVKSLEYARERGIEGPPQEADECLRCHTTGHGIDPGLIKFDLDRRDGVQCESCHGPGSDYRKKSVMADHQRSVENGLSCKFGRHIPQSRLCLACHNDESPSWDPGRYVLPDGMRVGFDYAQAAQRIRHPTPEKNRGRVAEIEKALREEKRQRSR